MKRGRKKDPENVAPGSQPKAVLGEVTAPAYLDDLAAVIFGRIVATLDGMNILTVGDLDIVAMFAEVASLGRKHKALLDTNGATSVTKTGFVAMSADYLIWRDCYKSGQKFLNELGLTPAGRTRVAAAVLEEPDELTEFLARRNESKAKRDLED
jgi:P27 family predicted phage terminase small subunit